MTTRFEEDRQWLLERAAVYEAGARMKDQMMKPDILPYPSSAHERLIAQRYRDMAARLAIRALITQEQSDDDKV